MPRKTISLSEAEVSDFVLLPAWAADLVCGLQNAAGRAEWCFLPANAERVAGGDEAPDDPDGVDGQE